VLEGHFFFPHQTTVFVSPLLLLPLFLSFECFFFYSFKFLEVILRGFPAFSRTQMVSHQPRFPFPSRQFIHRVLFISFLALTSPSVLPSGSMRFMTVEASDAVN